MIILANHTDAWVRFKCATIRDFCRDVRQILKQEDADALLGAFVVPWTEGDYDDAIHEIIAQDFEMLAEVLDVFSPMSYHAMCGWPVEWVGRFNEYLTARTGKDVWPIVQATEREERYGDAPVDPDEFRRALTQGLSGGATGVLMFTVGDCTAENGKLEVMRQRMLACACTTAGAAPAASTPARPVWRMNERRSMQCLLWWRVDSPKILELAAWCSVRGFSPQHASVKPTSLADVK